MRIVSTYILIIIINISLPKIVLGQTTHNNDLWVTGNGNILITDRWGGDIELHYRMAHMGQEKQQFLFRPSIFHVINASLLVYAGYTHIETYPYGVQAIALQTQENNYWIQFLLKQIISKVNLSHRYRYKSRWIGNVLNNSGVRAIDSYTHRNRFRYRVTIVYLIKDSNFTLKVFNEFWINFGENVAMNGFDQNWLYAGIDYSLSKQLSTGCGYMWQVINKPDGIRHESNNTIQLTLNYKLKLNK